MKTYKGFDKNLQCRGFRYEVGKEYEIAGEISVCNRGFHACESPLEVFDHYDMLNSRYCEVEQTGEIDKERGTTKVCSSKIKVVAELKLADMIRLGVEWLKEVTQHARGAENDNGGDYAKIGSSGYSAQIGSSGDYAKIDSTGSDSVICCAGNGSVVRAKKGSWITLSEWKYDDPKERAVPICVKTEYVDGDRIKADTWYCLKNGIFCGSPNKTIKHYCKYTSKEVSTCPRHGRCTYAEVEVGHCTYGETPFNEEDL